jgi:hypothetical protein
MRYAKIINGLVENVELWSVQPPAADGVTFVELADDSPVGIGHTYDGENFTAPEPEPVVEPVPESVGPAQIRLALLDLYGVTDEMIRGAIDQFPEPNRSRALVLYDYSAEFRRGNPFVAAIGQMLGINDEQVDDLFRYAITL